MTIAKTERGSLARLQAEKEAAIAQLEEVEAEIETLRESLIELQDVLTEKTAALEETRKAGGKTGKVLDKLLKEIGGCVSLFCFENLIFAQNTDFYFILL